jgi:hypothetical protein
MILFSLIVPTRGRPDQFRRLLDSLRNTARNAASVEVIAVVDADDAASQGLEYPGLALQRVIVPPGQTMGRLNLAGYAAARGKYLMLLNDDVVARTPGWDEELARVLEYYPDGIILAHANDLLAHDRLCTFPLLRREFCELAGGICRPEYRRWHIDEHIQHIFDLLHVLGYTRRIYLPEVIFEHLNRIEHQGGKPRYVPERRVEEEDQRDFQALSEERRRVALACAEYIEGGVRRDSREARQQLLAALPDFATLRRREYAQWWDSARGAPVEPDVAVRPELAAESYAFGFSTRLLFWVWGNLAAASACCGPLARLGLGIPPALFDAAWYRKAYPEIAPSRRNPLLHFLRHGGFTGYNPNPHFHSRWYLAMNPDVAASGLNPLVHFVRWGAREGRSPNPLFHVHYYRAQPPEIAAHVNPLEHFLRTGMAQGRSPSPGASLSEYLRRVASPPAPAAGSHKRTHHR